MEQFYSIQELVELQSSIQNPKYPKNRQGFEYRAKKEKWQYQEVKSQGRNGLTKKYIIPVDLAICIHKHLNPVKTVVEVTEKKELIEPNVINAAELMNWQRDIAENRLYLVRFVQQQVHAGVKKTHAIEKLVEDAQASTLPEAIQQAVAKANAKAGEGRGVSRRTLIEWIKAVEDAEKRKLPVIAALAPKPRRTEIPAWAPFLMKLWAQPQKPALAAVVELLPQHLPAGVECPSYQQAYRFLTEKVGNVEAQKGRMGSRDIKNIKPFIRRDTSFMLPTQVYTADGHCFDAEVAHPIHGKPFRPELTVILDVATRRVVGWSVDLAENTFAVLDALRMACCEHGIPAIFYVDNGSGYKNQILEDQSRGVLARLNITVEHSLPYNSQAKGLMERSHQSIWVKAAKQLPTFIGKPMDAEAAQKVHKLTRKEIAVVGQKPLPSWNDFLLYVELKVEQYNNKPHKGLKRIVDPVTFKKRDQTPNEAWAEALEAGTPIHKVGDWDAQDLFRPYQARKVLRCEISLFNNIYFSRALEEYHGDTVLVGYDIHDAEKITVRNVDGQFICHAIWNDNKRDYFPKAVIQQAVEKRAAGRKSRLDVKMDEVMQEMSPRKVIEHIEDESIVIFTPRTERLVREMAEVQPSEQPKRQPKLVVQDEPPVTVSDLSAEERKQKWMQVDADIYAGHEVSESDRSFWKTFQLSRVFKNFEKNDAELVEYLAQRQA